MYETIVCILLVVILPYLFHKWVTSAYKQDKLFFAPKEQEEDIAGQPNVGTEGENK